MMLSIDVLTKVVPSENPVRRRSSGTTLVAMVQSPDLGERDNLPELALASWPPFRLDEDESLAPSGPDLGEPDPQKPVGRHSVM